MSVLVTEAGLGPDDWAGREVLAVRRALERAGPAGGRRWLSTSRTIATRPTSAPWLDRLAMIRVAFPAMGDGRGFSIARRLRAMGYAGRLRAAGPLIPDQFRAARRVGYDEVELPDGLATRQGEELLAAAAAGLLPGARDRLTRGRSAGPDAVLSGAAQQFGGGHLALLVRGPPGRGRSA